ncbi:MAG: hypothetical protein AABX72_02215 [Nanoarchaeota archaeon]
MMFVLFLVGLFVLGCTSQQVVDQKDMDNMDNDMDDAMGHDMGMGDMMDDENMDDMMEDHMSKLPPGEPDVTFTLTGANFKFMMNGQENPELRVKQGDRVRIMFSATEGMHDWVVDAFGAATQRVRSGDEATVVEFIADKTGSFEYYCGVGSHREQGMKGSLIVE